MKLLLGVSGIWLLAGARAQLVQPARLDPDNPPVAPALCSGWENSFSKGRLSSDCGSAENNPCAVFTKKHDVDNKPLAACGSKVGIQTIDSELGIRTYIYGQIAGYLDMDPDSSDLALEYGAYSYACPFPCIDNSNSEVTIKCVTIPENCAFGFFPAMRTVTSAGIVANHLVGYEAIQMNYKFDDAQSVIPDYDPNNEVNESNVGRLGPGWFPDMWEIKQGDEAACVAESGKWEFTPEEAYIPKGCGVSGEVPCPMIQSESFGRVCYDPSSPQCYDVTFWTDGVEDPNKIYCTAPRGCPSAFHTRQFRFVDIDTTMKIPIGVWRDFCPLECSSAHDETSGVCAASRSDCVHIVADTEPATPPTAPWDYKIPGSKDAHIRFVSAAPVDCDGANAPSNAHRGAFGGLTAFLMACSVAYNM